MSTEPIIPDFYYHSDFVEPAIENAGVYPGWSSFGTPERYTSAVPCALSFDATLAPKSFPVIWDTGASAGVTYDEADFVGPIKKSPHTRVLKGLAKGLEIKGEGILAWKLKGQDGQYVAYPAKGYLVPASDRKLLSPQCLYQQVDPEALASESKTGITLQSNGCFVDMPWDTQTNFPMAEVVVDQQPYAAEALTSCVLSELNQNLTHGQKELLRWHYRFGHLSYNNIQKLLRTGALGHTNIIQSAARSQHPTCASCMYGKARRRPTKAPQTPTKSTPSVKAEDLFPGREVSMDHFTVSQKGRLFESRGRTPEDQMYSGGCIFYDHASEYIVVQFQVNFTASQTILAKQQFEKLMFDLGVVVQGYHTDNGVFTARDYIKVIEDAGQTMSFSGVGAHHQNPAERAIGTVFSIARTMMLHAAIRWPEMADPSLWPMAIDYAVWLYNHMPKANGIAPIDLLSRTTVPRHGLKDAHVWGCPVYVLDPKLQDGKKIPKFNPRSRRGVFMGLSPKHSSTVPLVMKTETLAITPQFHVVFDDWFTSVVSVSEGETFDDRVWHELFSNSRYYFEFDDDDPVVLDQQWLTDNEIARQQFDQKDKLLRERQQGQQREQQKLPEQPSQPEEWQEQQERNENNNQQVRQHGQQIGDVDLPQQSQQQRLTPQTPQQTKLPLPQQPIPPT